MNPKAERTIQSARALLGQWRAGCWGSAVELEQLLAAEIPEHSAAALYPYLLEEWESGYLRVIECDQQQAGQPGVEPLLSMGSWNNARILARSLPATSPYLTQEDRALYRKYAQHSHFAQMFGTVDHLHLIVMLLHALATSPDAPQALDHSATRALAEYMLTTARHLIRGSLPY
jgi:hypothetical protein